MARSPLDPCRTGLPRAGPLDTVGPVGALGEGPCPSANLQQLVRRVWNVDGGSSVAVTLGAPPPGYRPVEQYVVVPRASAARWLLPSGAHPATLASLWRYLAMKRPPLRVARAALTATFASGAGYRLFPDRLVVSVPDGLSREQEGECLLLTHLGEVTGVPSMVAAIEVRRANANANAKPTLQLFDRTGEAIGYARVGWSPGTRQLVRADSAALRAVHPRLSRLITPRLVASGSWQDREFSLASPLPEPIRRWSRAPEESVELLVDVFSSGAVVDGPLTGSTYAARLRSELRASAAAEPGAARVLLSWLDVLEQNPTPLRFGRWHGDWVPWNHGQHRGRPVAWDWEHSAPGVPVGFDLLHWHFQQAVPAAGLEAAVDAVRSRTGQLAMLGVPAEARLLVASLYLLEMFARVTRMAVGGGGWNPRFHPHMLRVAGDWAAHGRDRLA